MAPESCFLVRTKDVLMPLKKPVPELASARERKYLEERVTSNTLNNS